MAGLWLVLLGTSCSVDKFVPEGKYLYAGADIKVEHADSVNVKPLEDQLAGQLGPNPTSNKQVKKYGKAQEAVASGKKEASKIKNPGDEPLYYEPGIPERVLTGLDNTAENNGYFFSRARYELDTVTEKQIKVKYTLAVGERYEVDSIFYAIRDSSIARVIREIEPKSILKLGQPYTIFRLKNERSRIENELRDRGYYYFSGADLEYLADTLGSGHGVQLLMKLKEGVRGDALEAQKIDRIIIDLNYDIDREGVGGDTLQYDGLEIICYGECTIKPSALAEAFSMRPNDLYNPEKHRATLQRLSEFNTFRYLSLEYEPTSGSDSSLVLTTRVTPKLRRTVEGEVGAAFSANYFGPEVGLSYINRNMFRGAELFRLDGDFTYAFYLGNASETRIPSSGIYQLTASLNVPRLWLPNHKRIFGNLRSGNTQMQLGGNLESIRLRLGGYRDEINDLELTGLQQQLENDSTITNNVSLYQLTARYGYAWQKRVKVKHSAFPFTIRFQNPQVDDEELLTLARSLNVSQSQQQLGRFDRMILYSPDYTYLMDTRLAGLKKHNFFYQQRVAANYNNIFPSEKNSTVQRESSFYLQWESDVRYYLVLSRTQQIALRFAGSVAFPFTERAIVPYFDLYTLGGPNSLRGFAPRGVGPGPVEPQQNSLLSLGGYGNLSLLSMLEFRQRVGEIFPTAQLEIALFADAGNVWLYKTERDPVEGEFAPGRVLQELAIDAGIGFRVDLDFLLFRLDLAVPLREPYPFVGAIDPVTGEQAAAPGLLNKLNFVLAFGYPF